MINNLNKRRIAYIQLLLLTLIFAFISCKKEKKYSLFPPGQTEATLQEFDVTTFPKNLFSDEKNIKQLAAAVASNQQLKAGFEKNVINEANTGLKLVPNPLASVTVNAKNVGSEGYYLRAMAYYWLYLKYTGASSSTYLPYITKVRDVLLVWANSANSNSDQLPQETNYLGFFEAYSAIRAHISPSDRSIIDSWLIKKANYYIAFKPRTNNWETIRLTFIYYLGYIFSNQNYINTANTSYQTLLNVNVLKDGKSEDLVKRDAFVYHAYDLLFYGKIFRARYLYEGKEALATMMNLKSSSGTTVGDMVSYWEPFVKDPANNQHLEFVNTDYAPDKERDDYNKPYSPSSTVYAMEDLLLAFPNVKSFIQAVNQNNNQTNRSFYGFIYWDFKQ